MDRGDIPHDVRTFVNRYIHSVELLEVLLLVRAARDKRWSTPEVARALTTTPDSASLRLKELVERNLVDLDDKTNTYRYAPGSNEVDTAIDRLAEAYAKRRTTIIALIFSGPSEGVLGFAEAFRLRDE